MLAASRCAIPAGSPAPFSTYRFTICPHFAQTTLWRLQLFFFFSSRRRHTRSKRDWSSDVCSSDLMPETSTDSAAPSPSFASFSHSLTAAAPVSWLVCSTKAFVSTSVHFEGSVLVADEIGRASCRERVGAEEGEVVLKSRYGVETAA